MAKSGDIPDKEPSFLVAYMPLDFGTQAHSGREAAAKEIFENYGSAVFVLDPPSDPPDEDFRRDERPEGISERTGKRSWRIRNPKAFQERTLIAEESNLLRWAGQHETASFRDRKLERPPSEVLAMPNIPLETKRTDFGNYLGFVQPLFPELGSKELQVFAGVEEELLNSLRQERPPEQAIAQEAERQGSLERRPADHLPQNMSLSLSGSCMIIDGV